MSRRVTGRVLFADPALTPPEGVVKVRLLDTSRADAAAITISESDRRWTDGSRVAAEGIAFSLSADSVDERRRYEVSALVDLDGDGETSVGDFITMESYPVLTRGYPDAVTVRVHRID